MRRRRPLTHWKKPSSCEEQFCTPRDVRVEGRPDPTIEAPTDAILRASAACVCGSDLWAYRGIEHVDRPRPMGHEYVGIVEEVGADVRTIQPGQFVVGSRPPSIEAVGTQEAMLQAIRATRPGGHIGNVDVAHDVSRSVRSCSTPKSTCTAALPRCAGPCPS